jgi:hypothetical protein
MDQDLLIARSVTQAQHMLQLLRQAGIRAAMSRAPVGLSDKGCSYALRIPAGERAAALARLSEAGQRPSAVFTATEGGYREVAD